MHIHGNLVQTLNLQASYDTKLNNATYDALKAFQLNTINSSTSDLSNSKIRDIEASVNTFFNSVASNFNMNGYNRDILKTYVPALVYTMYDGYYIYSSYTNTLTEDDYVVPDETNGEEGTTYQNDEKLSGLKPYIHYSCRYKKDSDNFVINYALDNYITVYGYIDGEYVYKSGYLINGCTYDAATNTATYRGVKIEGETLKEYAIVEDENGNVVLDENGNVKKELYTYTKINGVKYYKDTNGKWFSYINGVKTYDTTADYNETSYAAVKYYQEAVDFTTWVNEKLGDLRVSNAVFEDEKTMNNEKSMVDYLGGNDYKIFPLNDGGTEIEEPNSNFNQHRLAVIRYSIEKNLSVAIANYNNYSGVTTNFQMPKLKEDEWEKILNNISIISFLQGLNIGGKVYNGYSIITNTKNEEVVSEDSIYIATEDGYYHKPTETGLKEYSVPGYTSPYRRGIWNVDLERKSKTIDSGDIRYYYPREELASYSSVVNSINVNEVESIYDYLSESGNETLAKLYFTALGRERYSMYKTSNDSEQLKVDFSN